MIKYNIPNDPYLRDLIRRIAKPEKSLEALIQTIAWYRYRNFENNLDVTLANFEVGIITRSNNSNLNCDAALAQLGITHCPRCYKIEKNGYIHCCFCLGTGYMHKTNISEDKFVYKPGLFEELKKEQTTSRFDKIADLIYK